MIRYFATFLLLFSFPFTLLGQNDPDEDDEWSSEGWEEWKDDIGYDDTAHKRTNWAGIDIASTGYLTPANKFSMPLGNKNWTLDYGRSVGWNLNLFEKRFPIAGPYFGMVTGVGFDWDRYAFERNVSVSANPDSTWAYEDGTDYDVNKLKTTFLRIPLLFEVNTAKDPESSFHLSLGVIGAWRIYTKFHQEFEVNNTQITRETKAKFNVNSLRYSLTTRFGYGNYSLFLEYSPMPLFERGEGPELYPFSAGITLLGI